MNTITLGAARIGDAPGIAQMSRALIEAGLPWSWTTPRVAAHMRDRESLVVTAKTGRKLVGFAMAQFGDDMVHLTLLAVAPSHRRLGIGRRLIAWVEESAVVAGLFFVKLEMRAGNQAGRSFYSALGYKECGVVPRYYSGVEDALRFTHDLRVPRPA